MASENNVVKGSNLGFLIGIVIVVALVMFVLRSDFVKDRFGRSNEPEVLMEATPQPNAFEVIDEPEITLLEEVENGEIEDLTFDGTTEEVVSEEMVEEVLETHEPVDTAIGDINPALLSLVLVMGGLVAFGVSKKIA